MAGGDLHQSIVLAPQEIGPAAVTTVPAATTAALCTLGWFWRFSLWTEQEDGAEEAYETARTTLLSALNVLNSKMMPALHYLTNHLFKDYINYGPLWHLMEEGAEAVHAVHNQFCCPSTHGHDVQLRTGGTPGCP